MALNYREPEAVLYTKEDERVLTNLNKFILRHYDRTIKFKLTEIALLCYIKGDHSKFSRDVLTILLAGKMEGFDNFEVIKIFRYLSRVKYNGSNCRS
jgi:hypothetical protein